MISYKQSLEYYLLLLCPEFLRIDAVSMAWSSQEFGQVQYTTSRQVTLFSRIRPSTAPSSVNKMYVYWSKEIDRDFAVCSIAKVNGTVDHP